MPKKEMKNSEKIQKGKKIQKNQSKQTSVAQTQKKDRKHCQFSSNTITNSKLKKALSINSENFVICKNGQFQHDYQIIDKIGQGSFGSVFKIKHKTLHLERALKKIKKNTNSKFSSFEQIEVLRKLDHANILKIFQFYENDQFYFIVTQIFEGRELFDEIIELSCEKINEQIAARVIRQILATLKYTHSLGIAHRDIKPENILVRNLNSRNNFKIKIIDWGLGTLLKGSQSFDRVCGTPDYAAPEIFQGRYSVACDMWSLGVLTFIMLTGNVPFRGKNTIDTIAQVKKGVFSVRKNGFQELSQKAKDFINRLIQKDVSKRLTAAEALQHPWIQTYSNQVSEPLHLKQTLQRLKNFNIGNHFGAAVINIINNHFCSREEKEKLEEIFKFLDSDGDGVLSLQQLTSGYTKLYGQQLGSAIAQETFKKLDVNSSGTLQYSQFIAYAIANEQERFKQKLRQTFNIFDSDKNGTISFSEISSLLEGKIQGVSQEQLKNVIMKDIVNKPNGQEQVTFQEFFNFMNEIIYKANVIKQSKKRESSLNKQSMHQNKTYGFEQKQKLRKTESVDYQIDGQDYFEKTKQKYLTSVIRK